MAENDTPAPLLGVSWDGTGFGVDQTIWGGEFLRVTETSFERVGHWRCFRLPGGETAVQEPRRAALGLLHAFLGDAAFARTDLATVQAFTPAELRSMRHLLETGLNAPITTSAGRLFDAVASLIGLRQKVRFEGQAAMDLEFALERDESDATYHVALTDPAALPTQDGEMLTPCPLHRKCRALQAVPARAVIDWGPMVLEILADLEANVPAWEISAKFHNTLGETVVAVARRVGDRRVVLTGGCFQNRYLLERTVNGLRSAGFSPYWHQRVPPNDGGIALGQAIAAARAQHQPPPQAGSGARAPS
jgi:hydrogenase maturation protein HypF